MSRIGRMLAADASARRARAEKAMAVLKKAANYHEAELSMIEAMERVQQRFSHVSPNHGPSQESLDLALADLDAKANALLPLVMDAATHEAYATVLAQLQEDSWRMFVGIAPFEQVASPEFKRIVARRTEWHKRSLALVTGGARTGRTETNSRDPNYDVAVICRNGHIVTWDALADPDSADPFCETCGAPTLRGCENCLFEFRGRNLLQSQPTLSAPSFCVKCGFAMPWTSTLFARLEQLDKQQFRDEMDRTELPKVIERMVKDTPGSIAIDGPRLREMMRGAKEEVRPLVRSVVTSLITNPEKLKAILEWLKPE